MKFGCGGHLGRRAEAPDTFLNENHPRTISSKFSSYWANGFTHFILDFIPTIFLFLAWRPSWLKVGITGHNYGRGLYKDHSTKVWLQLAQWFLKRRFLCEFPIGFYVKLSTAVVAILVEGPNRRTHFWMRTIQWLFHQNLVLIEQMVSHILF